MIDIEDKREVDEELGERFLSSWPSVEIKLDIFINEFEIDSDMGEKFPRTRPPFRLKSISHRSTCRQRINDRFIFLRTALRTPLS